ncbi:MAG: hypothetical protein OES84_02795 [Kiritimatiellaceae bacterium]|nr:hypothetical protein [Kiritimatiellaceae bacterium]
MAKRETMGMHREEVENPGTGIRFYFDGETNLYSDWHDFDSIQFILLSCHRKRAMHGH